MSANLEVRQREVVDLLATWGASAQPELAELFRVIAEYRGRDALGLLEAVLSRSELLDDPGVAAELSELRQAAEDGAAASDPSFDDRVRDTLARLGRGLGERISRERRALGEELDPWARLIEPARLDAVLGWLWRSEKSESIEDQLEALGALARARSGLGQARDASLQEIRDAAGSAGDDALRRQAEEAVDSADPARLSAVSRSLRGLLAGQESAQLGRELGQAAERLAGLCEQARGLSEKGGAELGPGPRELLAAAVRGAEEALGRGENGTRGLRALNAWNRTLGAVMESLPTDSSGEGRRRLAAELTGELRGLVERRGADGAGKGLDAVEEQLSRTATTGGPGFHAALRGALELLDGLQSETAELQKSASEALREKSKRLSALLEKAAPDLPTERVVRARLLIERVEGAIAARDPAGMSVLGDEIDAAAKEAEQLVERIRRARSGKAEAERERLREEALRLLDVAPDADAGKLKALVAELDRAKGSALGAADRKLAGFRQRIEGGVRLRAGRALARARKQSGKEAAESPAARLEQALLGDDLAGIAKRTAEAEAVGGKSRGPVLWIAAAVVVVLLAVGGFFGWRWYSGRPQQYRVVLAAGETAPAELSVTLVKDGVVFGSVPYAEGGVAFALPDGRYEVFVNDRYTGAVIRVPEDTSPIEGIPVP